MPKREALVEAAEILRDRHHARLRGEELPEYAGDQAQAGWSR